MSELRELLEKATPGPWGVEQTHHTNWVGRMKGEPPHQKCDEIVFAIDRDSLKLDALEVVDANADLIAHLRNNAETYAGLADDNKRLEERVAELEAARSARSAGLAEWSAASASRSAVNESIADKLIELLDDKP